MPRGCDGSSSPHPPKEAGKQRVELGGALDLGHVAGASGRMTLREPGISSAKASASRTVITRSSIAPHDQGGADDLGDAVAEVVVEVGLQRLEEAGLAGAAELLGGQRRRAADRGGGRQAEGGVAQPGAARDGSAWAATQPACGGG